MTDQQIPDSRDLEVAGLPGQLFDVDGNSIVLRRQLADAVDTWERLARDYQAEHNPLVGLAYSLCAARVRKILESR